MKLRNLPFILSLLLKLILTESSEGLSLSSSSSGATQLPPLVPLDDVDTLRQQHFFSPTSNWVIPGKVMQGRNPNSGRGSAKERVRALRQEGGISTFVCLQAEIAPLRLENCDCQVMGGSQDYQTNPMPGFTSYAQDALDVMPPASVPPQFVHFGIRDFQPAESLEELTTLITHLQQRVLLSVETDEILYIHCWGGKGRAGLVSACLLGALYNYSSEEEGTNKNITMDAEEALQRIQTYCSLRNQGMGTEIKSPETEGQKQQVRDFFKFKLMVE